MTSPHSAASPPHTYGALVQRVIVQPGWHNSGPAHWQSLWERRLGPRALRVPQRDWESPDRDAWVATLRQNLMAQTSPAILLAHSIGCITAAHLLTERNAAELKPHIAAAILVAPADVERKDAAPELSSFRPIPNQPLGLPALVIASANDTYCTPARAAALACAWQADFVEAGEAGHLNADAGYGPWPEGWKIIESWLAQHGLAWPVEGDEIA